LWEEVSVAKRNSVKVFLLRIFNQQGRPLSKIPSRILILITL
jgi:hypothetical protein